MSAGLCSSLCACVPQASPNDPALPTNDTSTAGSAAVGSAAVGSAAAAGSAAVGAVRSATSASATPSTPPTAADNPEKLLNTSWDARCPQASPGDQRWDHPDRLRKAKVQIKASPVTSLRAYVYWTNTTDGCLRVDMRTLAESERENYGPEPVVLKGRLAFDAALQPALPTPGSALPAAPPLQFDFPEPRWDQVYSLSVPVHCTSAKRSECRSVYVEVLHPSPAFGGGITLDVRDGTR